MGRVFGGNSRRVSKLVDSMRKIVSCCISVQPVKSVARNMFNMFASYSIALLYIHIYIFF